jgi:uncharacterized membrane protein YphA (DoxX/SURF4 family)
MSLLRENGGRAFAVIRRKTMNIMNIALWIVQILLALAFLLAGSMKVSQPIDKLKKNMNWTTPGIVRLVGTLEILGGLGLILPAVTHILPWLTPVAAVGLVLTMIGAAIVHVRLKEFSGLAAPIVLLLLALFIVYGRFLLVPLS